MKNTTSRALILLLFLLIPVAAMAQVAASTSPTPTDPKADALKAAEAWLALLDAGQFPQSWDTAAPVLQKAVAKDNWGTAVQSARGPFGKLQSRKLESAELTTSLPGAPAGQYVVAQYGTTFENHAAVETVTAMLDTDGQWRVAGYYVHGR